MKITMYELLGMVKDGKAPKTIMYGNRVWKLFENNDYYNKKLGIYLFDWFDDVHTLIDSLNDEVLIKVGD